MNRERLFRLCALLAGIGLLVLYAADQYVETPYVDLQEVDRGDAGKNIRVNGTVAEAGVSGDTEFFTLRDGNSSVQAVSFSRVGVNEGDKVSARGHVSMYHGKLEFIVEEVQK